MKKIFKALLPCATLATLATSLIGLTSCGNGGGDKDQDETNHAHVGELKAAEAGKAYEFSFTLDENYSLNMEDSTIQFADQMSNAEVIKLANCSIDSANKKITVPAELVTSSTIPTIKLLSEKQNKVDDIKTKKELIEKFYFIQDNANLKFEGSSHSDFFTGNIGDKSTWEQKGYQHQTYSINVKDGNTKFNCTTFISGQQASTQTTFFTTKDEKCGYWCISSDNNPTDPKYVGVPVLQNTVSTIIFAGGFDAFIDFDSYVNGLQYDNVKNSYGGVILSSGDLSISLNFYLNKDKNKIKSFEFEQVLPNSSSSGNGFTISKIFISDKGQATETITVPEYTKTNVYNNFTYDETSKIFSSSCSNYSSGYKRIETTLEGFTGFDNTKKTYLYFEQNDNLDTIHNKLAIYVDGQELNTTQYSLIQNNKKIQINEGVVKDKTKPIVALIHTQTSSNVYTWNFKQN